MRPHRCSQGATFLRPLTGSRHRLCEHDTASSPLPRNSKPATTSLDDAGPRPVGGEGGGGRWEAARQLPPSAGPHGGTCTSLYGREGLPSGSPAAHSGPPMADKTSLLEVGGARSTTGLAVVADAPCAAAVSRVASLLQTQRQADGASPDHSRKRGEAWLDACATTVEARN